MTRCVTIHLIPWSNFVTNFHWSQLATSFTKSLKWTYQRANSYIMEAAVSSWQFHRYSCPGSSDLQEEHRLHFSQVCILFHCCNLEGLLPAKQIWCPMQNAGMPEQILLGWMKKLPILYGVVTQIYLHDTDEASASCLIHMKAQKTDAYLCGVVHIPKPQHMYKYRGEKQTCFNSLFYIIKKYICKYRIIGG